MPIGFDSPGAMVGVDVRALDHPVALRIAKHLQQLMAGGDRPVAGRADDGKGMAALVGVDTQLW